MNIGDNFIVNLPLLQNNKLLLYKWLESYEVIGIGWYDNHRNIHPIQSISGNNALFHLLDTASKVNKDRYTWSVSGVDVAQFKIDSLLITFVNEVSKND